MLKKLILTRHIHSSTTLQERELVVSKQPRLNHILLEIVYQNGKQSTGILISKEDATYLAEQLLQVLGSAMPTTLKRQAEQKEAIRELIRELEKAGE